MHREARGAPTPARGFPASLRSPLGCSRRHHSASLLNGFVQEPPILAELHFRFVDRDLNKPRAELGFLAKPPQCPKCLQHRFLSDLFGVCFVLNDRKRAKKYRTLVGPDQFVESLRLSSLHATYEGLFEHVALYLGIIGLLRAQYASSVPLLRRYGYVKDTISTLEQAKQLSGGEVFAVNWIAGVVHTKLPSYRAGGTYLVC
jgi:hypothetical protein